VAAVQPMALILALVALVVTVLSVSILGKE
jgi:hypothetical protein